MRIYLIGPRGSGKTTAGRALAARLGWTFADADDLVEAAAGKTIRAIFAESGEPAFRDLEAAAIRELATRANHVVATGGGAVLRPATRELLRATGFVVWLSASPAACWARIQADPATADRRPNLAGGGFAEVEALMKAREPLYRETAHGVADAGANSPEVVAGVILAAWNGGTTCR